MFFNVFNATFNNISVTSWRSVLSVEETGVPGENHRPVTMQTSRFERIHISIHVTLSPKAHLACSFS
jgi:hypothetical protein